MAKIVNLDALVGEDLVINYEGHAYRMPGDIDVDTVFELFHMFTTIGVIEATEGEAIVEELKQKFVDIRARLLELLQVRNPKLEKLPFGMRGTGIVLRLALAELGVEVAEENPTASPAPRRTPRKTSSVKKRAAPRKRA